MGPACSLTRSLGQDWGNVVWGSRSATATQGKSHTAQSTQEVNAAMRSGNFDAVRKVKLSGPSNFYLLDNADGSAEVDQIEAVGQYLESMQKRAAAMDAELLEAV